MAVLGHVDAIIFEGGIGEHNPDVLSRCVTGLEELGKITGHNVSEDIIDEVFSRFCVGK